MSSKIKAVRVHRYSGLDQDGKPLAVPGPLSEVISIDEIDAPPCTDGHVLIAANYAGVQYPDALQAQGLYQQKPELPYVPGMDLTGRVLEVGAGVDHVAVGDRVIAQTRFVRIAIDSTMAAKMAAKAAHQRNVFRHTIQFLLSRTWRASSGCR